MKLEFKSIGTYCNTLVTVEDMTFDINVERKLLTPEEMGELLGVIATFYDTNFVK